MLNLRGAVISSPLNQVLLCAEQDQLTGLYFADTPRGTATANLAHMQWVTPASDPVLGPVASQLAAYFAGELRKFEVPVRAHGSDFARSVWSAVAAVGYGCTASYGELAAKLGNHKLARQVGQAVAGNPVSVIVPCHRIVGSSGALTGYSGGLSRKRALLDLEAVNRDAAHATDLADLLSDAEWPS